MAELIAPDWLTVYRLRRMRTSSPVELGGRPKAVPAILAKRTWQLTVLIRPGSGGCSTARSRRFFASTGLTSRLL